MRHSPGFSFGPAAGESPVFSAQDSFPSRPVQNRGLATRVQTKASQRFPILWGTLRQRLASPILAASLSGHPSLPTGP